MLHLRSACTYEQAVAMVRHVVDHERVIRAVGIPAKLAGRRDSVLIAIHVAMSSTYPAVREPKLSELWKYL